MHHDRTAHALGVGQPNVVSGIVRRTIVQCRAALANGDFAGARQDVSRELDSGVALSPQDRAALALMLARLLAAQGQLSAAEQRLSPILDDLREGHSAAAHIFCASAVELAAQGDLEHALDLTLRAERLAPVDMQVQTNTADLYVGLVPALILDDTATAEVPDALVIRVLQLLIQRFVAAPTNAQLAHALALLAEWWATTDEVRALKLAVREVEQGDSGLRQRDEGHSAFDPWQWAIRCWVLLAFTDAYWQLWHQHLADVRGEPGSRASRESDVHVAPETSLERIRRLHERLREIYRQPDSPLHDPLRADRHQRYLVELETEHRGAQALADLMAVAPDRLRSSGFVGPLAGIGLLAAIGRSSALQQFIAQHPPSLCDGPEDRDLGPLERLRQSLSPFSPMYAMHELGWASETEAYCRQLAEANSEPRQYLCSLLCQRARAALDGGGVAEARTSCVEALRLSPRSDAVLNLFADISLARVNEALVASRTDFAQALKLSKEDLAEAPGFGRLKDVVAHVLRSHAQHLRNLLGDLPWSVADARRISALQNEAWRLDPDPELVHWTLGASRQLVAALVGDLDTTSAAAFEEAEAIVMGVERTFAGEPSVDALRVGFLRTHVTWHLRSDERIALLRGKTQLIETLARQVERAWNLDRERVERDEMWTVISFAQLAEAYIPSGEWPATLTPYDAGLALVARGLRLIPGHPELMSTQAELLRLKGTAIINREGGYDGAVLGDASKSRVLGLYAQSWTLDASSAERALAMARSCVVIRELGTAERYAHAAVLLEPDNAAARDLWAYMRAQPTYEAAARDSDYAEHLIDQGRYRDAVAYLRRADQTLIRVGYDPAWEPFVELHRIVRHNLAVLQRSGFW